MKKKILLMALCLIISIGAFSQTQLKGWHAGNRLVDLRTTTPVVKPAYSANAPNPFTPGYNSIYDSEGKLLFYIVNNKIYNKFNSQIGFLPNGPTGAHLNIGIAPFPNNGNCQSKYYVFYFKGLCCGGQTTFEYVVVDMGALNGIGSTSSPVPLISTIGSSEFPTFAISKTNAGTRFLYLCRQSLIQKFDITASGITGPTTIYTGIAGEVFSGAELELSDQGDKLAWTEGSFGSIGAVGLDVNMLTLNPVTGLATAGTLYSFNSGYSNATTFKGIEFDASGNFLFVANGNTGVIYKDLTQVSTGPIILVANTLPFINCLLEKSYQGTEIICGAANQLRSINAASKTLNAFTVPFSLPVANLGSQIFLMPDQIDGENYDIPFVINVDVDQYTASANAGWTATSNPFFALQQNTYLGNLTSFNPIRVANRITIPNVITVGISGMEFQFHTNASLRMNGGSNLNLAGAFLHAHPCGKMWQGVVVNDNSSALTTAFSSSKLGALVPTQITDAIKGVEANGTNAQLNITGAFPVSNVYYDNEKHIVINNGYFGNQIEGTLLYMPNPLRDQAFGSNNGYGAKFGITAIEINNTASQTIGNNQFSQNDIRDGQFGINIINSNVDVIYNSIIQTKAFALHANSNWAGNTINVISNQINNNFVGVTAIFGTNLTVQKNNFLLNGAYSVWWKFNYGRSLKVGDANNSANKNIFDACNWASVIAYENRGASAVIEIGFNDIKNAPYAGGIGILESVLTPGQTYNSFLVKSNTMTNMGSYEIQLKNIRGISVPGSYNLYNPITNPQFNNINPPHSKIIGNNINFSDAYNPFATAIQVQNSPNTVAFTNAVTSNNSLNWQNIGIDFADSPLSFIYNNYAQAGRGIIDRLDMTGANVLCNTLNTCVEGIELNWEWMRPPGINHGIIANYGRQNIFQNIPTWGAQMGVYYSSDLYNKWCSPNTTAPIVYTGISGNIIQSMNDPSICGSGNNISDPTPINRDGVFTSRDIQQVDFYKDWKYNYDILLEKNDTVPLTVTGLDKQRLIKLVNIQRHISNDNYSAAQALLGNAETGNSFEANLKRVFEIIVSTNSNQVYSQPDNDQTEILSRIAALYPWRGGPAVYFSRAILKAEFNLDFIDADFSNFVDTTGGGGPGARAMMPNSSASSSPEVTEERFFNIYPNPTNGHLNISIENQSSYNFSVINILGVVVQKGEISSRTTLNLSEFAKGIYMINFVNKQTSAQFKKSIVLD